MMKEGAMLIRLLRRNFVNQSKINNLRVVMLRHQRTPWCFCLVRANVSFSSIYQLPFLWLRSLELDI